MKSESEQNVFRCYTIGRLLKCLVLLVSRWINTRCLRKQLTKSRRTSAKLQLSDQRCSYLLAVVASHNKSRSPESRKLPFAPYKESME